MHRSLWILVAALAGACTAAAPADDLVLNAEARSADGVPIRYDVRGAGEPTIVLVHGWTNDRSIWGEHVRTLARSHRVVALDLAGHGVSGAERSDWTMDAFGEDVVAVADDLGLERVVLVGFSMGGAVVLEAAERMADRVIGVVFVDTFHDPDQRISDDQARQVIGGVRAGWGDTAFVRAFGFTPDAPDSIVYGLHASMPAEPREEWFEVFRGMAEWVNTQFEPTLRGLDAPVAAINATQRPTDVEGIRRLAPAFTLDTISGVGHAGILLQRTADFDRRLLALVRRFDRAADR